MCATDVAPNRLDGGAERGQGLRGRPGGRHPHRHHRLRRLRRSCVVPPTTDKSTLTDAIDNLTTSRGTVIGAATLQAIDAIATVNPDVPPIGPDVQAQADQGGFGPGGGSATTTPPDTTPAPVPPGGYEPDIIVLLTDGANTRGISPGRRRQAGRRATRPRLHDRLRHRSPDRAGVLGRAARRRRLRDGGFGGGGFGGGGGGGGRNFLTMDEATLKAVAAETGGTYYQAQDAEQLRDVFAQLPSDVAAPARGARDQRVVRARPAASSPSPPSACRCGGTGPEPAAVTRRITSSGTRKTQIPHSVVDNLVFWCCRTTSGRTLPRRSGAVPAISSISSSTPSPTTPSSCSTRRAASPRGTPGRSG